MSGRRDERDPESSHVPRRAGFWVTIRAVLWAFFGVRRKSDYHRDATSLDPRAIIVAGLVGGLVFVLVIVAFVRFIVATT
jgi:amino acid transporter